MHFCDDTKLQLAWPPLYNHLFKLFFNCYCECIPWTPRTREFHYDAEVGEAKMNMQAIDKAEIHQSPKIFSSRSEKTLFHGGGHESKQNTCSTLVARIEGEIIESDMKPHQVIEQLIVYK